MMQASGLAPMIVFEGIDGSGKGTQAQRLQAALSAQGRTCPLLSFPRYQLTFFGARIGEFLNGEFGTLDSLDPFLVSLLYAGDRFESRETLEAARREADLVILDRYVASNIAHQSAKKTGTGRQQLREWIEQIEHSIYRLPRPELVILLDIPVDVSQQLIRRKQRRSYTEQATDLQEADVAYLAQVREVYRELAEHEPDWAVVPVAPDGQVRPVEEIAAEVLSLVEHRLLRP